MLLSRYWRQAGPIAIVLLLVVEAVVDICRKTAFRIWGTDHVHLCLHMVQFAATLAVVVTAARGVRRARLRQRRQSRHYATLADLSKAALQEENPEKLYQRCVTLLVDVLKCDAAVYVEANEGASAWNVMAKAGRFASLLPEAEDMPWGPETFGDYVMHSTRQPVHVRNFPDDKRFVTPSGLNIQFSGVVAIRIPRPASQHGILVAMFRKPTPRDSERSQYMYGMSVLLTRYLHTQDASRARENSDALLHQMAEHIEEVFYVANADGSKVHYVSPAYEKIWQASAEALYQNPGSWIETIHKDDRAEAAKMLREHAPGSYYERNYRVLRADGDIRWIRDRSFPIVDKDGHVRRVAGLASDVTEVRAARDAASEAMLRKERTARAKAESLVHSRDEVLAIVSHDLRNPLSGISLLAQRLNNYVDGDPKGVQFAERIQKAVDRMERLVQDLIEVSRLESGVLRLERQDIALDKLWQAAGDAFAIEQGQVTVVFSDPSTDAYALSVDAARILQVLGNLISNAVRFTPAGGTVRVSVETADDDLRFCVQDAGPGIPQKQLAHLFEPFWQGNDSDKSGLGLGLHIAKSIVEAHGGTIGAQSTPPQGALVWFTLPCASHALSPPIPDAAATITMPMQNRPN